MGGVDPLSRETILREILLNYNPGSTMLLSTHLVSEVEAIFERVLFIDQGRILEDVDVERIRQMENLSVDAYFRKIYKNKEDRHVG
jgi:ABC-2 type transport system ATP-binding protein